MNIFTNKYSLYKFILLCLLSSGSSAVASNGAATDSSGNVDKTWHFKVFLDDQEIGYHNFALVQKDNHQEIYSNARFDVKFLFFNAYSYRHDNVEKWNAQCLKSINAVTDDNGELYNVSGKIDTDAFVVNTGTKESSYLPCIKTFAYWEPDFLEETALLNSQTGEMVEIGSEFIGRETLKHNGKEITARRYRLTGEDLQIDLWYSDDDHWLALESLTENGSIVRYSMP